MKNTITRLSTILMMVFVLLKINMLVAQTSQIIPDFLDTASHNKVEASNNPKSIIPWEEDWSAASFFYNAWTFTPEQGPWSMVFAGGNPSPTAGFLPQGNLQNYSYCMQSMTFHTAIFDCSLLFVSFDIKHTDIAQNGSEHFRAEAYWLGVWHTIADFANEGSFDWTTHTYDVTEAIGNPIVMRFTCYGSNSDSIVGWYIDNISITTQELPALNLDAEIDYQPTGDVDINLTWNSPDCPQQAPPNSYYINHIFDDGSFESTYPIAAYQNVELGNRMPIIGAGLLESFDVYFDEVPGASTQQLNINIYNFMGFLIGTSEAFIPTPNTWINVLVPDSVEIFEEVYAMVHWDSLPTATHALAIDQNGPYVSQQLGYYKQGLQWKLISEFTGANGVFLLRANAWMGADDKVSSFDLSGKESKQSCIPQIGSAQFKSVTTGKGLRGYNVYRDGQKINEDVLADTSYTVRWTPGTSPEFKVTSVHGTYFGDEESDFSNSFTADITDALELNQGNLSLLPNPASTHFQVSSPTQIDRLELINTVGKVVLQEQIDSKYADITLENLAEGVYLLRITDNRGKVQIAKLCHFQ